MTSSPPSAVCKCGTSIFSRTGSRKKCFECWTVKKYGRDIYKEVEI